VTTAVYVGPVTLIWTFPKVQVTYPSMGVMGMSTYSYASFASEVFREKISVTKIEKKFSTHHEAAAERSCRHSKRL
jgi:hypothetical protein